MHTSTDKKEEAVRLLFTFCAGLALCCVLYAANGRWPFGEVSVVTGDLGGQYINYFAQMRRSLLAGDSLSYAFTKSLGGSMEGIIAYYAASPFNLLYMLLPPFAYAQLASVVLALKLACACTAFACYAGRHWGLRGWSVPMGLCYGFMSYNLAYAQNIMWHDGVILLPLICVGIDALVRTGKPFAFLGWLTLAIYSNFYIAYMLCIFSVLYFGMMMLLTDGEAHAAAGGLYCFWGRRCASFAAGALCAGMLCGVVLVPWLANISVSKGIGGSFRFDWEILFPLRELAQRLWPGSFSWPDVMDGLPNLYCGLFAAVLAFSFFVCRRVTLREKLLWGALTVILTASFLFSGLNLIWHGFAEPVWFPYRNSFLVSFVLLVLACGTLARGTFSRRGVAAGLCLLAALSIWTFFVRYSYMTLTKLGVAGIFLMTALALLVISRKGVKLRPGLRRLCAAGCALLIAGELAANGILVLGSFEEYTVAGYQKFYAESTQTIDAVYAADADEYRIEKTFYRSYNDPMLLGYHGLKHFGSTQDNAATQLLHVLGLDSGMALTQTSLPTAEALVGVKYLLARPDDGVAVHYVQTGIEAPHAVYQNPYVLPLAFYANEASAGQVWPEDSTSSLFEVQNAIYTALTGRETALYTEAALAAQDVQGQPVEPLGAVSGSIVYTFTAPEEGPYYFWIDLASTARLAITVNGAQGPAFPDTAFQGAVYLGDFRKGQTVDVRIDLSDTEIKAVSAAWFDTALWIDRAQSLQAGAQTLTWRDGSVTGSISAEQPELLFTSIPWDENWSLTVNGKEISAVPLLNGTLTGIPLSGGENDIRLQYRVPYRGIGLVLTTLGALGTAAMVWLWRRKRRAAAG